jgi:hypothetical protein
VKKQFTRVQKENAVLRCLAGEKTEAVAASIGVDARTIQRWAEECGRPLSQPGDVVKSPKSPESPDVRKSPEGGKSRLDRAAGAAGTTFEADQLSGIPDERVAAAQKLARSRDEDFCVTTAKGLKSAFVVPAAPFMGLDPSSAEVQAFCNLTPFAEQELRVSAPIVAPLIRKYLGENIALVICGIALSVDLIVTGFAFYGYAKYMAKERAKEKKEKGEPEKPERREPPREEKPEPRTPKTPQEEDQAALALSQAAHGFWSKHRK